MLSRAARSLLLGAAGALVSLFAASSYGIAGDSDPQDFSQLERGRYLVTASDCTACHTVPGSHQPFAGGRPIETPFGSITTPNITPDRDTGIGAWSDDAFDAALRKGVRPDGSRLYPAMPYPSYTKMSRDDVIAIRAYLNTVTPVHNSVTVNTLPFPFNIRATMRVWDWLYFTEGEFKPDPQQSAEWNRGAFLVQGPRIAALATRRRAFSAATRPANICKARSSRAGSRRTSPMPTAGASADGRRMMWWPI